MAAIASKRPMEPGTYTATYDVMTEGFGLSGDRFVNGTEDPTFSDRRVEDREIEGGATRS